MSLEFELLETEEFASLVTVASYFVLISVIKKQELIELKEIPQDNTLNEILSLTSWIRVYTSLLFTITAFTRLEEREKDIAAGTETGSIEPNINISLGAFISLIGAFIIAVGIQQRAQEAHGGIIIT
jgi:hypothetical protein